MRTGERLPRVMALKVLVFPSGLRKHASRYLGIVPHRAPIDRQNVSLLDDLDFVFLSVDGGASQPLMVQRREQR